MPTETMALRHSSTLQPGSTVSEALTTKTNPDAGVGAVGIRTSKNSSPVAGFFIAPVTKAGTQRPSLLTLTNTAF